MLSMLIWPLLAPIGPYLSHPPRIANGHFIQACARTVPMVHALSICNTVDYNIYALRTSYGPVPGVQYLQYGTCSQVPDSCAYWCPYLLFRNQLIGNEGSYWLVQILWLETILLE